MSGTTEKVQQLISSAAELTLGDFAGKIPGTLQHSEATTIDPTLPGNPASKKSDIGNVECLWNPYRNKGRALERLG